MECFEVAISEGREGGRGKNLSSSLSRKSESASTTKKLLAKSDTSSSGCPAKLLPDLSAVPASSKKRRCDHGSKLQAAAGAPGWFSRVSLP